MRVLPESLRPSSLASVFSSSRKGPAHRADVAHERVPGELPPQLALHGLHQQVGRVSALYHRQRVPLRELLRAREDHKFHVVWVHWRRRRQLRVRPCFKIASRPMLMSSVHNNTCLGPEVSRKSGGSAKDQLILQARVAGLSLHKQLCTERGKGASEGRRTEPCIDCICFVCAFLPFAAHTCTAASQCVRHRRSRHSLVSQHRSWLHNVPSLEWPASLPGQLEHTLHRPCSRAPQQPHSDPISSTLESGW